MLSGGPITITIAIAFNVWHSPPGAMRLQFGRVRGARMILEIERYWAASRTRAPDRRSWANRTLQIGTIDRGRPPTPLRDSRWNGRKGRAEVGVLRGMVLDRPVRLRLTTSDHVTLPTKASAPRSVDWRLVFTGKAAP